MRNAPKGYSRRDVETTLALTFVNYTPYGNEGPLMPERRAALRKLKHEKLVDLKDVAITALEHRGYEVRGKTTAQIRQILRKHPTRPPTSPG